MCRRAGKTCVLTSSQLQKACLFTNAGYSFPLHCQRRVTHGAALEVKVDMTSYSLLFPISSCEFFFLTWSSCWACQHSGGQPSPWLIDHRGKKALTPITFGTDAEKILALMGRAVGQCLNSSEADHVDHGKSHSIVRRSWQMICIYIYMCDIYKYI